MALPSFAFGLELGSAAAVGGERGLIGENFSAELTEPDSGLVRLPGWMRIQCASTGRTAQQSASTRRSAYSAHAPRAFSEDGATFGLLVEPALANLLDNHDLTSWTPTGTPLVNSVAGPDGVTAPLEVEDDDGALVESTAYAITPGVVALPHTLSAWHLLTAPAPSSSSFLEYLDGANDPQLALTVVDTAWTLASVTVADIASGTFAIVPRATTAADLGATSWSGIQLEQRSYSTSFHATTRLADKLEAVTSLVIPDGFVIFDMVYRPHYAHNEAAADHNLIFIDSANRVYFRQSDANIVFVSGGDELASGALTFDAHDTLTLFVENSANRRRLVVSGALTGDATVDGATQPALEASAVPTYMQILGGATGAEEGADLLELAPNLQTFKELADCRALVQMDDSTGTRNFRDLLRVIACQPGRFYDACNGLKAALELETAVGAQLDLVGAIVGLAREGFDDDDYRRYLTIQVELLLANERGEAMWTGTVENILRIARTFIGPGGPAITLTNLPPYSYHLDLPAGVLTIDEAKLLARFLTIATYAAVLGFFEVSLSADTWGSDAVAVGTVGTWGSASVVVAGASIWDLVITT
jgi:hypothetical protein